MKFLMSGNEAVARGAWEAGVDIAAAYPGTPSTEILENISKYKDIYSEWSVNEKVAFEIAYGAAIGGKRALAAMKHVGVNVASDALLTAAYTGVNAGLVFISADDPGMHSSQNEQDNRNYGRMAQIPILEPSGSQEAKEFTKLALELSEKFDTPIMLRMTTRICHGKGIVEHKDRQPYEPKPYVKNPQKHVMIPGHARVRHQVIEQRLKDLQVFAETFSENKIEIKEKAIGVITSGICYQYVKEALPNASIFKIGMTYPLPMKSIKKFAKSVDTLYVVEELDPFFETQIKAAGVDAIGKAIFPRTGEINPEMIREKILGEKIETKPPQTELPARPPVMCAGCPHRAVFHVLKKMKAIVSGDIGCYTLSVLPPLATMDTCVCMGGSVGVAQGLQRALGTNPKRPIIGVLGDSTFSHSGIPSLVSAVYNKSNITLIILDNRITAMTGHQENPGTGRTLSGEATHELDFAMLARSMGVKFVKTLDPINDIKETEKVFREAVAHEGPSVVIARRPCVLIPESADSKPYEINQETCIQCKICLRIGCPAISMQDGTVVIDPLLCDGCSLCSEVCPQDAISQSD